MYCDFASQSRPLFRVSARRVAGSLLAGASRVTCPTRSHATWLIRKSKHNRKSKSKAFCIPSCPRGQRGNTEATRRVTVVVDNSCDRLVVCTTRDQRWQADGGAPAIRAADWSAGGLTYRNPAQTRVLSVFVAERQDRMATVACFVSK